jgi:hypothetical protein
VVVFVVARVVDWVVDSVVGCVVDGVAAVDVPENDWAARAERPPVSRRPSAAVLPVMVEMRRSPASRRSMGSEAMST